MDLGIKVQNWHREYKLIVDELLSLSPEYPVLLFARDGEYLKIHMGYECSYHDCRDMNINDCDYAIDYILSRGGYVVTFGKYTRQSLNYTHERVIHYAGSQHRSDFMDIYLSAHCLFIAGSASGACDIASIGFNKPFLSINQVPIGTKALTKNSMYIPKKVKELSTGKMVGFRRLYQLSLDPSVTIWHTQLFEEQGYAYVNCTKNEIRDAVIEFMNFIENGFVISKEDQAEIDRHRKLYPENHPFASVNSNICSSFLNNNKDLFQA